MNMFVEISREFIGCFQVKHSRNECFCQKKKKVRNVIFIRGGNFELEACVSTHLFWARSGPTGIDF